MTEKMRSKLQPQNFEMCLSKWYLGEGWEGTW